jgi:hypothetical protein
MHPNIQAHHDRAVAQSNAILATDKDPAAHDERLAALRLYYLGEGVTDRTPLPDHARAFLRRLGLV